MVDEKSSKEDDASPHVDEKEVAIDEIEAKVEVSVEDNQEH